MTDLRISLVQTSIVWEDKPANLLLFENHVRSLAGKTDLVVLPEMFTTGFSMTCHLLAEENDGATMNVVKQWAAKYDLAIVGSFIAVTDGKYFNRAFFVCPDGKVFFYDKHHLFTPGGERDCFSPGNERLIVSYKGWNIKLLICYELRFPVWARNSNNEYDLLIIAANWPSARESVWDVLLEARALENQAYVCGVNRIGTDGSGLHYSGHSRLINAKGQPVLKAPDEVEWLATALLNKKELDDFRIKFPVWKDADPFEFL